MKCSDNNNFNILLVIRIGFSSLILLLIMEVEVCGILPYWVLGISECLQICLSFVLSVVKFFESNLIFSGLVFKMCYLRPKQY